MLSQSRKLEVLPQADSIRCLKGQLERHGKQTPPFAVGVFTAEDWLQLDLDWVAVPIATNIPEQESLIECLRFATISLLTPQCFMVINGFFVFLSTVDRRRRSVHRWFKPGRKN